MRTGCEPIGAAGGELSPTRARASRPGPSGRGEDAHDGGRQWSTCGAT